MSCSFLVAPLLYSGVYVIASRPTSWPRPKSTQENGTKYVIDVYAKYPKLLAYSLLTKTYDVFYKRAFIASKRLCACS